MKQYFILFVLCLTLFSCQREPDQTLPPATDGSTNLESMAYYTPNGYTKLCDGLDVDGPYPYRQNEPLTKENIIKLWVSVKKTGIWLVHTNTVNGMQFAGTGTFNTLGSQFLYLYGSGTPLKAGNYRFLVTFKFDGGDSTCNSFFEYTVDPTSLPAPSSIPNAQPIVNAGPDLLHNLPNSIKIYGSAVDPDGTIKSYQWSKITGPSSPMISNPGDPQTSISGLVQGIYTLELKATDDKGGTGRDTVQIKVVPGGEAVFTLPSHSDRCVNVVQASFLIGGSPATADQYIQVWVNAVSLGNWTLSTPETNGVRFAGSGTFTTTGEQAIRLYPTGTPPPASTQYVYFLYFNEFPYCPFHLVVNPSGSTPSGQTAEYYYKITLDGVNYSQDVTNLNNYQTWTGVNGLTDVSFVAGIEQVRGVFPVDKRHFTVEKFTMYNFPLSTKEQMKAFFAPGTYPYSYDYYVNDQGVQIQWVDKDGNVWDSSYGTHDQTGSNFKIISVVDDPDLLGRYYVKVKIQFNCKLYKENSNEIKTLTNGECVLPFGPK